MFKKKTKSLTFFREAQMKMQKKINVFYYDIHDSGLTHKIPSKLILRQQSMSVYLLELYITLHTTLDWIYVNHIFSNPIPIFSKPQ
jgi:hypothetical protein